ncbi:ATP-dependent nuclease [Clostridium perfringens]|uniref:ATP-dependent nuclease n=1 Tax=Clostridium perfringens TaxID=1502 RepID=UPI0029778E7B|nr:AAA family ATPase [Clostridium perfringens]
MNIKSIRIENFKSIENLKIEFNDKFNVLIGENNAGKTSVLEAILLWKKCYDSHIQQNKKKFYAKPQNIRFDDISFLRVADDIDLFNSICKKCRVIDIEIVFQDSGEEYNLGFEISKVSNIDNAYFQLKYIDRDEFVRFEKLTEKYSKKLNELISVFDTRPIAGIITNEPYMYKDQVLSKISKGKGYEVLRNKIIGHSKNKESKRRVENSIKNVIGEEIEFIEKNQNNREYIKLMVKKGNKAVDILSQGSGFIQIAEIFSSIEYINSELYILLIDEPDSHIHAKLQEKLLEEFKQIKRSQLFLVTHNERFLDNVEDDEIIFINKLDKELGLIKPLKSGYKNLVLNDIVGDLKEIQKVKYSSKILFLEGPSDKNFIQSLCEKYQEIVRVKECKLCYFHVLGGIDTLEPKLQALTSLYKNIRNKEAKWILLRDVDFTPVSKIDNLKEEIAKKVRCSRESGKIIFQNGYGIESSFFAEKNKLVKFLSKYYKIKDIQKLDYIITEINNKFLTKYKDCTSQIHRDLHDRFKNQKARRQYKYDFIDYTTDINNEIQYIMIKPVIDKYLLEVHCRINDSFGETKIEALNNKTIIKEYIENIDCIEDIYKFHLDLLNDIFEFDNLLLDDEGEYENII